MKVNNSIIAHGTSLAHTPSLDQVRKYISCSVEESPILNRGALAHTPFQVPHHDDVEQVAHTFDGRSGGLGLLMKMLDEKFGLDPLSAGKSVTAELKKNGFERLA